MEKKIKIIVHTQDNITNENALLKSGWQMTLKGATLGDRWEKDAVWHNPDDQEEAEKFFGAAVMNFYKASAGNKPRIHMAITDLIT